MLIVRMYCYRRGNRELSTKPFSFLLWYVLIDIQNEQLQQEKWGVPTEVFFYGIFLSIAHKNHIEVTKTCYVNEILFAMFYA